jgi:heat shock protein HslJ
VRSKAGAATLAAVRPPFLALGALLAVSVAACRGADADGGTEPGGTGGPLDGTRWVLVGYAVGGKELVPVPAGERVDAAFAAGRVSGSSGCNRYGAAVRIAPPSLAITAAVSTLMACGEAAMALEQAYLSILRRVSTYTATPTELVLHDAAGAVVATFAAAPADPLAGSWMVTGYNTGTQAVTSPVAGHEPTAVFADGRVSGSTGCSDYDGPYAVDGVEVTIGPLAAHPPARCDDGVMAQEAAFLAAFARATVVIASGRSVTLKDAAGTTQVVLGQG